MPALDAAALSQKIVDLEAAVATGKAREAAQCRRIAALEAENATLRTRLRKRPRLPEPPAALQQLVRALGARERDLRDLVFELACMPRYLAKSARDLPPDPVPRGFSGRSRSPFRRAPSRSPGMRSGIARA